MEDDLNFFQMEDDLIFLFQKTTSFVLNERRPQFLIEDCLNIFLNERQPHHFILHIKDHFKLFEKGRIVLIQS